MLQLLPFSFMRYPNLANVECFSVPNITSPKSIFEDWTALNNLDSKRRKKYFQLQAQSQPESWMRPSSGWRWTAAARRAWPPKSWRRQTSKWKRRFSNFYWWMDFSSYWDRSSLMHWLFDLRCFVRLVLVFRKKFKLDS